MLSRPRKPQPRRGRGAPAPYAAEPLEDRKLVQGPAIVTPSGLALASPGGAPATALDASLFPDDEQQLAQESDLFADLPPPPLPAADPGPLGPLGPTSVIPVVSVTRIADGSEEGLVPGSFRFSLTDSSCSTYTAPSNVTINFSVGGTALQNSDYRGLSPATVTVLAGQSSADVSYTTLDDLEYEGTETVQVTAIECSGTYTVSSTNASATSFLNDNEEIPVVTVLRPTDSAAADGSEQRVGPTGPTKPVQFVVSRGGPPAGTLVVHYTLGGTATGGGGPGADYVQPSGSVTFLNGQSTVPLSITPLDDALAEPKESVIVTLTEDYPRYLVSDFFGSADGYIEDNDWEWAEGDPIDAQIVAPADDELISINSTVAFALTASDIDHRRAYGGSWVPYSDDVTSGESASDYHIIWSATEGTFTDPYGPTAIYVAPDYVAGPDVRTVTITATVDDTNRGADTLGFNDAPAQRQKPVQAWQVTLTLNQGPGNVSANYGGLPVPAAQGGGKLGWIAFNNPPGSLGYHGATEIKGTVPIPVRPDGFLWYQDKMGEKNHAAFGAWANPPDYHSEDWEPDIAGEYRRSDGDARHPNLIGEDVREIFLVDAPGVTVGPANNAHIINGWTNYHFDMFYKTWVEFDGVRVSNLRQWFVNFGLVVQNGQWQANAHAP